MDDVCAQAREGSDVGKDGSGDVGRKGSYVDAGMKGKDDAHSIVVTMGGGDDAGRQERSRKGCPGKGVSKGKGVSTGTGQSVLG